MQPYAPRPIRFHGVRHHGEWRLKTYSIVYGHDPLDWDEFAPGITQALAGLPTPACTAERPGVGVLIAHRGRGADYVVLGWWDRENELPVQLVVRDAAPEAPWRPARRGESFCVWDLEVLGHERDSYVRTLLGGRGLEAREAYLADPYARAEAPAPLPAGGA